MTKGNKGDKENKENGYKIGEILRLLRHRKEISQDDAAKMLNVKRQTYGAWERGKRIPDLNTLTSLAELYGTSINEILAFKVTPPKIQSFLTEELCVQAVAGTIDAAASGGKEQKRFERTVQAMKDYLIDRALVAFGDTPGDERALYKAMRAVSTAVRLAIKEIQIKFQEINDTDLTEELCVHAVAGTIDAAASDGKEQKRFEQTVQAMKGHLIDRALVAFGDTPGDERALYRAMGAIASALGLAMEEIQIKFQEINDPV